MDIRNPFNYDEILVRVKTVNLDLPNMPLDCLWRAIRKELGLRTVENDLARSAGPLARITADLQAFSDKALEAAQENTQRISELTAKNAQLKTVSDTAILVAANIQKLLK